MNDDKIEQGVADAEYWGNKRKEFIKELQNLINRYSMESGSNTPDWILAEYLFICMAAFNQSVNAREEWYGRKSSLPSKDTKKEGAE